MSNDDHAILLMWVCLLLGFMLLLFCVWVVFVVVVCVCVCLWGEGSVEAHFSFCQIN